jgi:DNA mismatch repair protein MutL
MRCPPESIPWCEHRRIAAAGQLAQQLHHRGGPDGLWIIDQHVAHERILFEQVLTQQAAGRVEMQQLLMPVILQLTPEQQIEYARIADELA